MDVLLPFWERPSSSGLFFSIVSTFSSCWCDTSSLMAPTTLAYGREEWLFHIPTLDTNGGWDKNVIWLQLNVCFCPYLYTPWSSTARFRSSLHSSSTHTQPGGHSTSSLGTAFSPFWQTIPFEYDITHVQSIHTHPHIPHQCSPQACQSTVHQVTASDFQKPLRWRSCDQHLGQSEAYRKRVPCNSAACSIW